MKKIFTLFIAIIGFSIVSFSQTYTMSNSTVTACSGTFYDPGGTGTYANSQNVTMTFCSGSTDAIFLQFSQFVLESNFDYVYIYNGPSTASPLIGTYTGSTSPGTAVGTSGCITVRFTSDGSITYAGFTASISCGTPPPTPPPPSTNCNQAQPFCTGTSYSFPAATGSTSPAGPAYGCLGSQPNPVWYYLQVQNPGAINITAQGSNDIDFILWGPFASATAPCLTGLTSGTIVDCSFSGSATEYVDIPATAQAGQIYILLITNYANVSQNITFSQTGGIGTTNCQILCNITAMTGTPSACNNADNTYSVSGTISTYAPPTTGTLTISSSCGGSVVYNPPFAASYNYTLPGITANGGACTITASYSADPTCNRTVNYTSPAPCSVTCTSTPTNTGPYCDGSTIQLNSSGGDSYSWTGPNGFVSNLQNPTIPNATATNAGVYTLVTTLGTCTATSTTTVVVNSAPTLTATPTSETICSGQSTNISLTSNPVGASLSFSVNQSGVTGASAVNSTTIAQVLTATGATAGTATYTITPSIGTCIGSPISIPITVNPAPTVIATPTSESICSGQTTGINLTSNPAGSTFSWTVAQNNVSGASAGNSSSINQTLTSNPGTSGTATYTVTPSSGTCPGIPLDVIINVGSNPTVTATPSSQSICSGLVTGISLSSTPAGATFAWTVSQNNATGATSGNGSSIAQTLTNSSTSVGSVTYSVTPSFGTCVGTPLDVVITVNPAPSVVATPASQSICNGTSTGITLSSIPAGASFDWTVVQSNVNGGSAGTGSSINQSLSLSSGTTGSATYTITPSSSGCPGVPTDVVISVSAGPSVIASPETICSGGTSGVALSSNPAGASFNWTFNQTGVIGAFSGSGNSIAQTLNATTSNAGNVIYTVTANIGSCIGTPQDVVVTVNPSPVVTTTPSIQTICSGTPANIIFSSTPAGATFAWTVTQTGASGASAGSGNSVFGTYTATGPTVGTIVYDVVPTLNGCVGQTVSAVININPSPVVIATPASQTLCSGDQTNIALTSSPAGSSFSWTVAQNQVTGAFNGLGNTIAQTLSGTGTGTGTATYTVTPSASGCPGIPSDVVITIGSNPTVTATPTSETLCSGSTTGITLTSVPAGATFDWTINQAGVSGAVAGTGSAINQTLNTTGAAQGTVTYTITPSVGTCVGLPIDVIITVNPVPTVTSNPTSQAICSSTSTAINLTSSPGGANLDWTTVETNATGSSAGNGSAIFQILSTTGTSSGTVTYTITPSMSGCVGTPIDVPVTVNPVPSATATPSVQTICSASAASIALSSLPVGATFAWTITESGTAGATAGNGSTINQTLSTTGTTQGTTFYTITPTLGTCVGSSITAMVSVNPVPVVTATPSVDALCSGSTTNVLLTSLPGTTFDWTVSQTGVSGASGGTGSSIAQTLTTLGQAVGTVTYTVTPTLNGCVGTPVDVVITVNPIPTAIATPTAQTICSGDVTGISLSSTPAGATFDWTFSQTGTTGAAAGTGNLIAQTIDATSTNSGSVTYTITPTFATCVGSPIDVVISIGSNPIATATPSVQTICEGTATSIALTSAPAGATYAWTVSQIGASGASAGNGSNIAQTLNAIGTVPGTVTYTITPNVGTCVGLPIDVVITVNPTPVVSSNPTSQAICSATSTNITLTSSPVGASLDWTVNQIGTTGASAGNGSTIAQTLDVAGLTSGTATYTVTPTLSGCVGLPIDIVVTVNPTPVVSATPTTQTICSSTSPSIALSSTPTGAGFSWTVSESGTSGASAASGFTINQSLTATGLTQGTATYTISPTLGACIGSPIDVPIFVNPIPVVTATPALATICSGAATGITLSSSPLGATFDWTVVESNVSGASAGTGNGINQVLSSTSTAVGTATYTVTPTLNGCVGSSIDVVITVNPIPTAIATPASQTICSGDVTSIDLTSSPAGSTFGWTVNQSLASGATAGATANIAQVLNATTSNTGTVTYNVTPTLNSCVGSPLAVVISVAANPVVTATPASQTICEGTSTGIVLSSSPTGATFNWTSSETDVTGSSAGMGASIAQVLDATALVPGTVTYTINSNIGACVGLPIDVIVTVNPLPTAIATPVSQTICATTATSINLSSSPVGSTFGWTVSQSGTSGATAASGSTISQTLGVTGLVSGTTTYSVTPTLSGCSGSPLDVVITVDPTPTAIATPTTQTICSETAFSIDLTSSPVGSTFGWTVTELGETGANAGIGSTISETLTVTGITQGTVTYTITPSMSGCVGTPIDVPVTVNPVPSATATPSVQTICSASAASIALSSLPVGATFAWTITESGTAGATAGNGSTINQTLSTTGTTQGTTFYTITPTLGTCVGSSITAMVSVNPVPVVTATPSVDALCSGSTTNVLLTSLPGTTFDWTVSQTGVSGASGGTGSSIAQTLTTLGQAVGTVTYTVTPTLNGCVGTPVDVVITVNPIPTAIATPTAQTICSGDVTGISLSSTPAGATFDWTFSQTGTTGAAAGTGNLIAQTIDATSTNSGSVTYTITPTFATCVGSPIDVVISIGSNPIATATPSVQTICEGTATSIALTSAPAGATYAWTVSQIGASGASAGNGSNIAQTLNAIGTVPGTVTYTITPNVGTCVGLPIDVVITVNPTPVVSSNPTSQAICSATSTNITLTSSPVGASLDWTVNQIGTTGASAGNGSTIAQTLDVAGLTSGTATYTVTPTLSGCVGLPIDIVVTVNPTPVVSATPTTQTICSSTSPSIALSSTPTGAGFSWTVSESGTSGASAASGFTINQSLTATGLTQGTATYTISPTLGACIGSPIDVPIFVNPIPVVTATPALATICSGAATGITLSSSPLGATFDWTVVESNVSGASAGTGNGINQVLSSTSTAVGTATYTVTPTLNGCVGSSIDVVITVNPIPTAIATPASQTICSGDVTSIDLTSSPAGSTFGWTVNQSLASGATAGATANIAQVLNATTSNTGTVTYNVTPTLNSCVGSPLAVVISVAANPVVTATPASQTICEGTSTGIVLSSSPTGATFNWTSSETDVTGSSAGMGASIAQVLDATALVPGTVTYTINSNIGACVGLPIDVIVTVNPLPTAIATPVSQTICATTATSINLSSSPVGSTFGWTVSQSGTSGATAASGSTISQTLGVTGLVSGTTTYSVTPTLSGCSGSPLDVVITVDPTPTAIATPTTQTICSETAFSIDLTSSPVGSTFGWTVTELGETGANAGIGSTISETLTVTGITQGTVTYTITPSMSGCVGTPIDVPVTVNPVPSATATPSVQTICSASAASIALSSLPVGATFAWTITESGTAGATAGNGSTINQTLSTTGTTQGTTFYTITPTLGTCVGSSITAMVSVNPVPVVTATPSVDALCSGSTTNVLLTSLPGTTFDWTVSQTGVSGASGGTGSSIAQTLTTLGQAVGTVTYTVTPTLNGCVGTPVDVVITVNPIPTAIATPTAQTICSGDVTGISLSSTPAGATFDWTFSQTGTTGAAAGTGNLIAQTIDATSTNSGSVTYTITPTFATCVGSPIDVVISIGSNPIATATPSVQTICEGTATSIALTSAPAGATYAWTVSQIGASGASAGNGSNIAQTLNAIGTVPGTVTYTITPNVGTCVGLPIDVVITVNPTPVVSSNPTSQAICSATSTNITLTSSPVGASLDWTVNQIGTTGASAGNGSTIAQTLDVAGLTSGTATYTVTPTLSGCVGLPIDIVVTVNPTPVVSATPTTQTICSSTSPSIALSSTPTGAGFSWTVSESGTSGASAASGFTINQSLTATGLTQGTATYTISPTLGACIGSPIDVPIFVNPIPVVTATPALATICSGAATGITLSSSPLGATFDWTVVESNVSGASAGTGNGINQVLSSTSTAVGTATYTVTPTLNGCVGSSIDVVITVNPIPTAIATPASQTICSGDVTSIDLTSSPAGSTFGWTVNQSLASGATAGATANIAQVLNATTSNTGTVTYNVTPTLNSCVGSPLAVVISVAANPVVTATPASQTICEGTSTGIVLSSSPTGATFNWTSSETDVTGSSAGMGASIAQVLDATALVPGTVTYTINSNIGACVGLPIDVIVTVNPLPTAIATPVSQTICATTATSINLSSSPVGSTFGWTVSQSGTSGATAASGSTISQTLGVTGLVSGTTTYSVTPTLSGCSGSPLDVVITVDPTPTAIATPTTQTICSETAFSIDLTSSPVGSTFGWTVTELGETGANAGIGSTISETLTVTGITQGTATYTVTPTLGVCVGLPINVPIYVNPIPVVTALAAQDTICSATSTSITMSSVPVGASYAWTSVDNLVTGSSGGASNGISQVLSSTSTAVGSSIYTITPTLTGCVGLPVDVEITVNPLPTVVATPSDETLCSGETSGIVLTSSPAGSTFNWTVLSANVLGAANGGGDTIAQTLTSTVTGTSTYSITPTLNGCVGPMSSVVVTVNPNPTLVTNIGQGTLCVGSSISMDVSGAVNYVWSPATGLDTNVGDSVVATPPATQTYFITGTDINNCTSVDSIAITVNPIPVTTVTLNDTICEGISINLDAHGADSYAWTPSTGLNSITDSSIVATPLVTTTYTVTGTSLNCSSTATVTVYVKPAPTINAGVDSLICYGNSIVLSGSGAVSYAWSGGVVNNVPFFPTATQTYTVVGTGANQCQDSDQVVVSITPLPIIDLVPSITSGCVPQVVDFQNNTIGGAVYSWDFGDSTTSTMTNPSHNYTSIGCYDITLTASTLNGCTFTTTYPSMVCVELTPVASFFANPSSITTDYPVSTMVNTSQNAVAYSWDFGDGTGGSTDFMPEHTFPGTDVTTYTVELVVYSLTGCTDTARVNIQVYEDIVYFVPNAFTPDGDNFNQTFKPVFTSGYDPYDYSLFIYDRWGEIIFESHDASVGWDGTYGDGSGIVMDGTYVWTIEFKVTQTSERKKIQGHVNVLR